VRLVVLLLLLWWWCWWWSVSLSLSLFLSVCLSDACASEVLEIYPQLRPTLVSRLLTAFPTLRAQRVRCLSLSVSLSLCLSV
jgi:hypothetical protein